MENETSGILGALVKNNVTLGPVQKLFLIR
jgi:hypothetical protein